MERGNNSEIISAKKYVQKRMNKSISRHFREYCRHTSIHGFKYLGEGRTAFELYVFRTWWIICILLCFCFCCVMIYGIFVKYTYYPVIVTFSMKETRLQKLPYPAVTICPRAKISQKYFNLTDYATKEFIGIPTTGEEDMKQNLAATICDFEANHKTKKIDEEEFFDFLNQSNTKIFQYCQYLNVEYNCNDLFTPIITEEGICYSFNILDKNDIYNSNTKLMFEDIHKSPKTNWDVEKGYDTNDVETYPRRALRVGARNQLQIVLQTHIDDIEFLCPYDESGFRVSIHLPSDIPEVPENHILVPLGQKVIGAIVPHAIKTSKGVMGFPPSKRDCFFQSERHLKFFKIYSIENCKLECKTNFTLRECGCVSFHMPREPETPICFLEKLNCIDTALDHFSVFNEDQESDEDDGTGSNNTCNCRPTCTDASYNTDLSYNNIIFDLINSTFKEKIDFEKHMYAILSLYFKNGHVETKERNELYGFSDVISNFGGLLGLFTGFSILSFLEILYFLSLRLWGNMRIYGTWINPN